MAASSARGSASSSTCSRSAWPGCSASAPATGGPSASNRAERAVDKVGMSDPREPVALDPAKLVVASLSDPGRVRPENQDAVAALKNAAGERLFVVADGMGGQSGGEVAAKLCIDTLGRAFRDPHGKPEERLRRGLELANEEVYSHALSNPDHKGMGTTAVALMFARGAGQTWLAWIGDSRCYRLRDGALEALTRDHSLVAE